MDRITFTRWYPVTKAGKVVDLTHPAKTMSACMNMYRNSLAALTPEATEKQMAKMDFKLCTVTIEME